LLSDYWLREGTKIYKFQALIFEEEKPRGEIKQKVLGGK
jgi:AMMECR1 domain-containing protein